MRIFHGDPDILLDSDGTILSWNQTMEKLFGYTESEIIGQHFNIFYLPMERQSRGPEELLQQAVRRGKASCIFRSVRKDGSTRRCSICLTAIFNQKKEVLGFAETASLLPEQEND